MSRIEYVERWAHYVRDHPDLEWSEMQAVLIDSQLENSIKLTRKQVDYIKRST